MFRRHPLPALAVFVACILAILGFWLLRQAGGPIYSLAQVEAGLSQNPGSWVGRTVDLRGTITWLPPGCPEGGEGACSTVSPLTVYSAEILLVHPERDQLLERLRALPALGHLLPGPQPIEGTGLFRIRLEPAPATALCAQAPCYWAILPDADLAYRSG